MNSSIQALIAKEVIEAAEAKGLTVKIQRSEGEQNPRRARQRKSKLVSGNSGDLSHISDLTMPTHLQGYTLIKTINNFAKAWAADRDDMVVLGVQVNKDDKISLTVTPHRCVFNPLRSGFIYERKQDLYVEFGVKRITKKIQQKVEARMRAELHEIALWANNEVTELVVMKDDKEVMAHSGLYAPSMNRVTILALSMVDDYSEQYEPA